MSFELAMNLKFMSDQTKDFGPDAPLQVFPVL